MAEGCCASIIKILLFIFNFVFWVTGAVLLGVGIWLRVDQDVSRFVSGDLNMSWFYTACYVMIAAGAITMVTGFLGCCGAMKENKIMLMIFAGILGLLFLIELIAGILGVVYRDQVTEWTRSSFLEALSSGKIDAKSESFRELVTVLQGEYSCCGLVNNTDWQNPCSQDTCLCTVANQYCRTYYPTPQSSCSIFRPCLFEFEIFLKKNIIVAGGVGLAIAFIQLVGIVFSVILIRNVGDGENIA
ncbi:TSPAN8 [Branchiostoma lanceolatum]|uniref:Tetraspanin n=1 Tax=Branchiostoma lanceolatum TaxID=7740 RepID=A0A8J9ZP35_BRALA|nr:TSPAN8 [Branchiostoma lanceolatum]